MTNKQIAELRKIISEATPLDKWEGSGNYPFYITVKPPALSLSKHAGTPRGVNMWRYQDGTYLLVAVNQLPKALDEIERLREALTSIAAYHLTEEQIHHIDQPETVLWNDTKIAREALENK